MSLIFQGRRDRFVGTGSVVALSPRTVCIGTVRVQSVSGGTVRAIAIRSLAGNVLARRSGAQSDFAVCPLASGSIAFVPVAVR